MGEKFQVLIEVGHKATKLKEPVGLFTHKWNLFVRSGDESLHIDKLVQRVVFKLHETFSNSTRVCDTPPFCVKEQGYGEFELVIEIYFRTTKDNSKEANKYSLVYFLEFPHANSPSLNRVRSEKICFLNPTPEFRRILEESGAVAVVCSDAEQQQHIASNSITSSIKHNNNNNNTLTTSQSTSSLSMVKTKMKSSLQHQQSPDPSHHLVNGHGKQSIGSSSHQQNAPSPSSLHTSFKSTSSLETLKSDEKTMLNGNVKKKLIVNNNSNNRKSLIRNEIPKTATSPAGASTTTTTSENSGVVAKTSKLSPQLASSPASVASNQSGAKTTSPPSTTKSTTSTTSSISVNNKTSEEGKKESGLLKSNKINLQDYKARLNVKSPLNAALTTSSPPKIYDQNITSTTNDEEIRSKKSKTDESLISTTTDTPFNENEITSTNVANGLIGSPNGTSSSGHLTSTHQQLAQHNQQTMIMTPPPSNSSITANHSGSGGGGSTSSGSGAGRSVSPSSSSIPKSETGKEWNDFDPVVAQMKLNSVYSPPASHESTNGDNQITSTTLNASKTSPSNNSKPIESTKRKLETTTVAASHHQPTSDQAIIDTTTSNKKNAQISSREAETTTNRSQEEKKRKRDGGDMMTTSRDGRPRPQNRKNSEESNMGGGGGAEAEMSDNGGVASSDGEERRRKPQQHDRRDDRRRRSKSRKRSKNSRERKRHRHSRSRSRIRSRSRSSHSNRRRRRSDTTSSTVNTTSTNTTSNGNNKKKDEEERRRRRRRRRSSDDSDSRSSSNSSVNSNKSDESSKQKHRHHHHHRHHHRHRRRRSRSTSPNNKSRKRSQERKLSKEVASSIIESKSLNNTSNDSNGQSSNSKAQRNGKTSGSSNGKVIKQSDVNSTSNTASKSTKPEQLASILENEENSDSINKSRVNVNIIKQPRSVGNDKNKTNTNRTSNTETKASGALDENRMLRLYEGIKLACSHRQMDVLARVYSIVQPYSFTESSQFKFDLYALEPSLLMRLEKILSPLVSSSTSGTSSTTNSKLTGDNRINHLIANNSSATVKSQIT